jgi:mono/diheme cytochrome c family protein
MDAPTKQEGNGKAFALAVLVAIAAAASAFGLSIALRRVFARTSHQLPTPEAWVLNPIRPTPETVAQGRKVFLGSCAHCHGADATGDEGPDLHGVEASDRYIANIITHGIKGEMPSFRKKLGPADIHVVTAFVRSLEP